VARLGAYLTTQHMKRRLPTRPPVSHFTPSRIVVEGAEAEREVTRRGWPFAQYSGSVLVSGEFFIRGGSVTILRGFDLVKQWEDSVPGIRWVRVHAGETLTCLSTQVMMIASAYRVITQVSAIAATPPAIAAPPWLGTGGWVSLEAYHNGQRSTDFIPWFFREGSMDTAGTGIITGASQIDSAFVRTSNYPTWGSRFGSSNTLGYLASAAFNGVNLYGPADSRALPFSHRATMPQNSATGDYCIAFFEHASVTANFTFSSNVNPATIVKALFALVRGSNSGVMDTWLCAQMFAPGWIPAPGNKVIAYCLSHSAVVGATAVLHSTEQVNVTQTAPVATPVPTIISMQR
jgi:hypothetical protein